MVWIENKDIKVQCQRWNSVELQLIVEIKFFCTRWMGVTLWLNMPCILAAKDTLGMDNIKGGIESVQEV